MVSLPPTFQATKEEKGVCVCVCVCVVVLLVALYYFSVLPRKCHYSAKINMAKERPLT